MNRIFKTAIIFLILVLIFSSCSYNEPETRGTLYVHFIDVGQADSILVLLPDGENMLIDAGDVKDGKKVVNYLKNQNVSKIDYLVATHPHADHIGGMDKVIKEFEIGMIYMPKVSHDTKTFENLMKAIQNKGMKVNTAKAGVNILNSEGLKMDFLAPVADSYEDLNDYSAVIKLTYGKNKFLFMGDAQKISEDQITADVSADVLKVGHHGSSTSTTQQFLDRVNPDYAVISVGNSNSYNHPNDAVVGRLERKCKAVYQTNKQGTLVFSSDGSTISITP